MISGWAHWQRQGLLGTCSDLFGRGEMPVLRINAGYGRASLLKSCPALNWLYGHWIWILDLILHCCKVKIKMLGLLPLPSLVVLCCVLCLHSHLLGSNGQQPQVSSTHRHTGVSLPAHALGQAPILTHACTCKHTYTYSHACTHTLTGTSGHVHASARVHMHARVRRQRDMHTLATAHTYMQARAYTRHTFTHTYMHTTHVHSTLTRVGSVAHECTYRDGQCTQCTLATAHTHTHTVALTPTHKWWPQTEAQHAHMHT